MVKHLKFGLMRYGIFHSTTSKNFYRYANPWGERKKKSVESNKAVNKIQSLNPNLKACMIIHTGVQSYHWSQCERMKPQFMFRFLGFGYDSFSDVPESWAWLSVLNLFLSISMAYNVILCRKVAENTHILKIAKFAM